MEDPFTVLGGGKPSPPPVRRSKARLEKTCRMLLPVPEDAPPGTKAEECGKIARHEISIGDSISKVRVDVCQECKALHHSTAAALRHRSKRSGTDRKAS